jgi:hypothetical protein
MTTATSAPCFVQTRERPAQERRASATQPPTPLGTAVSPASRSSEGKRSMRRIRIDSISSGQSHWAVSTLHPALLCLAIAAGGSGCKSVFVRAFPTMPARPGQLHVALNQVYYDLVGQCRIIPGTELPPRAEALRRDMAPAAVTNSAQFANIADSSTVTVPWHPALLFFYPVLPDELRFDDRGALQSLTVDPNRLPPTSVTESARALSAALDVSLGAVPRQGITGFSALQSCGAYLAGSATASASWPVASFQAAIDSETRVGARVLLYHGYFENPLAVSLGLGGPGATYARLIMWQTYASGSGMYDGAHPPSLLRGFQGVVALQYSTTNRNDTAGVSASAGGSFVVGSASASLRASVQEQETIALRSLSTYVLGATRTSFVTLPSVSALASDLGSPGGIVSRVVESGRITDGQVLKVTYLLAGIPRSFCRRETLAALGTTPGDLFTTMITESASPTTNEDDQTPGCQVVLALTPNMARFPSTAVQPVPMVVRMRVGTGVQEAGHAMFVETDLAVVIAGRSPSPSVSVDRDVIDYQQPAAGSQYHWRGSLTVDEGDNPIAPTGVPVSATVAAPEPSCANALRQISVQFTRQDRSGGFGFDLFANVAAPEGATVSGGRTCRIDMAANIGLRQGQSAPRPIAVNIIVPQFREASGPPSPESSPNRANVENRIRVLSNTLQQ